MMRLPVCIQIGALVYMVREYRLDPNLFGRIDYGTVVVDIDSEQSEQIKPITLMHEILHGILVNAGYTDHPENILDALSVGLVDVIRNNPDVVKYFQAIPEATFPMPPLRIKQSE